MAGNITLLSSVKTSAREGLGENLFPDSVESVTVDSLSMEMKRSSIIPNINKPIDIAEF